MPRLNTIGSYKFETLVGINLTRYYQLNWQSTVLEINRNVPTMNKEIRHMLI